MGQEIIPDEFYDNLELIEELRHWIAERKDRMRPWQAVSLLSSEGARIAYLHAIDIADIPDVLSEAQELGRKMACNYLKTIEEDDE